MCGAPFSSDGTRRRAFQRSHGAAVSHQAASTGGGEGPQEFEFGIFVACGESGGTASISAQCQPWKARVWSQVGCCTQQEPHDFQNAFSSRQRQHQGTPAVQWSPSLSKTLGHQEPVAKGKSLKVQFAEALLRTLRRSLAGQVSLRCSLSLDPPECAHQIHCFCF